MNALRLAVAELNLDGVPAHAAVDGAVRLASAGKGRHLAGMVNAVARRVAEGGRGAVGRLGGGGVAGLAGRSRWRMPGGRRRFSAIAEAHRRAAPIDVTLKDPEAAAAWADALGAERLPTGSLRLPGRPRVSGLPGYEEGAWWVQDAAAALPARLLGGLAGKRALDVCAAPGGKTLQLAAAGAAVTALDDSEARLGRLRANLARTGLDARVVVADALGWTPEARFEAILVDAPCSASGTIRRHPDLPHLRTGRELGPLVALQAALLERAWAWLMPGGRLVYCVCSLLPAEGEAQVARFLAAAPGARVVAPDAAALGVEPGWIDGLGGLRLRPDYWPGARRNGRLLCRLPREAGRCRVTSRRGAAIRAGQT